MFQGLDDILCQEFIPERQWKFHFSQYIPVRGLISLTRFRSANLPVLLQALYVGISVAHSKPGVVPILYMVLTSPEERAEVMALTEQSEQVPMPVHNDKLSSLAQVVKVEIRMGQELDLDKDKNPCRKGDKQDWIVDRDSFSKYLKIYIDLIEYTVNASSILYFRCVLRYFEKKRGCPRTKGQEDKNQCDQETKDQIKHDILKLADYSRHQVCQN